VSELITELGDILHLLSAIWQAVLAMLSALWGVASELAGPFGEWILRALNALLTRLADWPVRETLGVALAALAVERIIGWPGFLQARIGHPVEWSGGMIADLEERLNAHDRLSPFSLRLRGLFAMLFLILFWGLLAVLAVLLLRLLLPNWHWLAEALLASPFLAQKSLRQHVRDVYEALRRRRHPDDLVTARRVVGRIVGRDTAEMDETRIVKAAIESLAENTSDGIIAPAFWLALFGLPGIVTYKVVNTADSMIGHRHAHLLHFGWAAARLDDLFNLIPARLTGVLYAMAAALTSPRAGARALHVMWRDARRHVSPNAGWPEAALAGALDISLGGPRSYRGMVVDLAWMGDGREGLHQEDIPAALALYGRLLTLTLALGFVVWLYLPD
jgi:adenosylcobinamide-phosphate synthase